MKIEKLQIDNWIRLLEYRVDLCDCCSPQKVLVSSFCSRAARAAKRSRMAFWLRLSLSARWRPLYGLKTPIAALKVAPG
jgi:hypothetical protein